MVTTLLGFFWGIGLKLVASIFIFILFFILFYHFILFPSLTRFAEESNLPNFRRYKGEKGVLLLLFINKKKIKRGSWSMLHFHSRNNRCNTSGTSFYLFA